MEPVIHFPMDVVELVQIMIPDRGGQEPQQQRCTNLSEMIQCGPAFHHILEAVSSVAGLLQNLYGGFADLDIGIVQLGSEQSYGPFCSLVIPCRRDLVRIVWRC